MSSSRDEIALPKAPNYLREERAGVLAVAALVNRLGLIWRENPMPDVGIDGQIEFVNDHGEATGQLAAVQVKSGASYFHDGGTEWHFHPAERHRFYWERFPIPVLIILHSPKDGTSYWVDSRLALRRPHQDGLSYIGVPKVNRLDTTSAESLFSSTGASSQRFLPLPKVLDSLIAIRSSNPRFPLSHFDLFANGIVDIGRSVYHSAEVALEVANEIMLGAKTDDGVEIGPREQEFHFSFVDVLVRQHLADVDLSQCIIDWYDHELQPRFIAPLTSRGRALIRLIEEWQARLVSSGRLELPQHIHVIQEGHVSMYLTGSHRARIPVIGRFQRLMEGCK